MPHHPLIEGELPDHYDLLGVEEVAPLPDTPFKAFTVQIHYSGEEQVFTFTYVRSEQYDKAYNFPYSLGYITKLAARQDDTADTRRAQIALRLLHDTPASLLATTPTNEVF